jgi:preprotein translocase subunit SecA
VLPPRCLPDEATKWQAVCEAAQTLCEAGRPVLVGTRSVAASETVARVLAERGVPHQVLNAMQDATEAAVVAAAGQPGVVTVATNMAGRGTDIELGPGVAEAGGLHVILTEFHESRRVDRQLFGRAARQGDPGSAQAIVCAADELLAHHAPRWRHAVARLPFGRLHSLGVALLRRLAQRTAEGSHRRQRAASMRSDREIETLLSFSGRN